MKATLVIGLTGGIGSGKSTVADLFQQKGITVIDTDLLSRKLTQPGQPALAAIRAKLGDAIIEADGSMNRAALRKLIFTDETKRRWLEDLLHPLIRAEMEKRIEQATSPYCIAVIPLLFETRPNPLIQRVLVVDAPIDLQIARTVERDHASPEAISAILKTQVDRETRLSKADDVINNQGSLEALIAQVNALHEKYLSLA